jgi:glutathione-regulated potassium-efflux system protein KefB
VVPYVLTHLARQRNKESVLLVVILSIFLAAWVMHFAGASMALGAFIMGVSLSDCRYRLQIQAVIEPFKGILMALFFVAVGMSINLHALGEQLGEFAQHIVVIVAVKFLVLFLLVLAFGFSRLIASRVALLLVQGGEFGFVIFASARVLHVIDDATFTHAIGIISLTMVMTPILDRLGEFIYRRTNKNKQRFDPKLRGVEKEVVVKKVIIGGYGRVGHAVAMILQSSQVPFVVFDTDPARVEQGKRDGVQIYYGDIGDPDLLATIKAPEAGLVVLTIDKTAAAEHAVSHIRSSLSEVPIIARARDLQAVTRLMEAGATHAYPEAVESSLRLGGMALEILNTPKENVDLLLQGVRSDNYKLVQ